MSAAELQRRQELEYEEDEGQDENVVELKHAVLSIPNIPMPKSSDGNVRRKQRFVMPIETNDKNHLSVIKHLVLGYQNAELRQIGPETISS